MMGCKRRTISTADDRRAAARFLADHFSPAAADKPPRAALVAFHFDQLRPAFHFDQLKLSREADVH